MLRAFAATPTPVISSPPPHISAPSHIHTHTPPSLHATPAHDAVWNTIVPKPLLQSGGGGMDSGASASAQVRVLQVCCKCVVNCCGMLSCATVCCSEVQCGMVWCRVVQ